MPVAPMFAAIMTGPATHLISKLCKVKNIAGHEDSSISVVKESRWNLGPGSANLEQTTIKVGTIGMVVGVAEPKTVLRFLVTSLGNGPVDGIYHLSVLNLEPLEEEKS
jgi:hypothetical protein